MKVYLDEYFNSKCIYHFGIHCRSNNGARNKKRDNLSKTSIVYYKVRERKNYWDKEKGIDSD